MYLTISEIEEKYKVSKNTLLAWEKLGYLRCSKTPGKHRRYLEEDVDNILNAENNEPCYVIRFDTYRKLPDTIEVWGTFTVGEGTGIVENVTSELCGWHQLQRGVYRRQSVLTADGFKVPYVLVVLKDEDVTNVLIHDSYPHKKLANYRLQDGKLVLNTSDLSRLSEDWNVKDNRFTKVPMFMWGIEVTQICEGVASQMIGGEIETRPDGTASDGIIEMRYVAYDRIKIQ